MTAIAPEDRIGLAEAAAELRVAYQKAHQMLLTGVLPGVKDGNRWYVSRQDVARLKAEREQRLTPAST